MAVYFGFFNLNMGSLKIITPALCRGNDNKEIKQFIMPINDYR